MQFEFNLGEDTAGSVASEMVDEMSLSKDDAHSIAAAIKEQVRVLTSSSGSPQAPQDPPEGSTSACGSPLSSSSDHSLIAAAHVAPVPGSGCGVQHGRQQEEQPKKEAVQGGGGPGPGSKTTEPRENGGMVAHQNGGIGAGQVGGVDSQDSLPGAHAPSHSRLKSPPVEPTNKQLPHIQSLFANLQVGRPARLVSHTYLQVKPARLHLFTDLLFS